MNNTITPLVYVSGYFIGCESDLQEGIIKEGGSFSVCQCSRYQINNLQNFLHFMKLLSIQFRWNYILDETEKRIEAAVQVLLHSVWVESPEGRGFTQEGNQNHRNSISRSGGDDPTFRESLRIRA